MFLVKYSIYENTRGHEHAQKHLEGYHHILQTDGYQAYEKLEGITHMGCWAHCRRKYKEALDSAPAGVDLKQTASYMLFHKINKLFQIEKETRTEAMKKSGKFDRNSQNHWLMISLKMSGNVQKLQWIKQS
ncbi:hypothetical protein B5E87_02560 [Massilimicrobiota sp. An142]|nr:hypothetical protein B5E87_02560 [Massilimicrobiota sp. An142]